MSVISTVEVVELISDLVRIESVTPWLVEGGAGEAAVAAYIADWLADLPVEVMLDEIAPGRVNVVATLRGTGGGPTLCLNAHADTVGYAGWPTSALIPRHDGDRLYGLGAADDKGCCAAALLALRALATTGNRLSGDLIVACVADEEGVSLGTEHLVRTLRADAAVVLEADALPRVVTEHQGFGWLDLVFHGRAAHGSAPEDGIDAIVGMSEALGRHSLRRDCRPEERADGFSHRNGPRWNRLCYLSQSVYVGHRDRHPAGGEHRHPCGGDPGDPCRDLQCTSRS